MGYLQFFENQYCSMHTRSKEVETYKTNNLYVAIDLLIIGVKMKFIFFSETSHLDYKSKC